MPKDMQLPLVEMRMRRCLSPTSSFARRSVAPRPPCDLLHLELRPTPPRYCMRESQWVEEDYIEKMHGGQRQDLVEYALSMLVALI